MKTTENAIKRAALLVGCLFLSSFLSVMADDIQESFNLDYFRTPEAAAFKKYGEVPVNGYTGAADISIPLYTIKCKDVEIPIVLRYDASGIKVEQEASWVGLGWNLMVGGCINYVCAGAHDEYTQCDISEKTWTEYLTNMKTPNASGTQYFHYSTDNKNTWMLTVPHSYAFDTPYNDNLSQDMKNYLMWGYGERDFYSVNILGKSFKFFIDPVTLNRYIIGEAGDDFKIEPYYKVNTKAGIGNQTDVSEWTITDSNGYVYYFKNGDTTFDEKGKSYTFCWYLTGIRTPSGETVELSYTQHQEWGRSKRTESYTLLAKTVSNSDIGYHSRGYATSSHAGWVKNSYLKEIKTSNQTVTFSTTVSKECSGRRLDAITVKSNDKTVIKTFKFSYSSFGYSSIGGNYAPANDATAELRLKLDNVKETASSETHTTSFSYNSLKLPSKKSCAQDYWGYYNGKDNPSTNGIGYNGHTLIPTSKNFMTRNYHKELGAIKGADRFSRGDYMQAAMLNRVDYPTGGYTTYEYEPNSILTKDFTLTEKYRDKQYDVAVQAGFYVSDSPYGQVVDQSEQRKEFTLSKETTCDLLVRCSGVSQLEGKDMRIELYKGNSLFKTFSLKFHSSNEPTSVTQGLTLSAGKYALLVIPINGNNGKPFSIRYNLNGWYKETTSKSSYTLACGGLRIKKVSNYDSDKSLINYVTYDYNDKNGTTGILLNEIETIEPFNYNYLKNEPNGSGPATVYSRHPISGWTISTGQTRFPAFFASCNPGDVGYSQVTNRIYDANGNLEKSIVTSYINHKPKTMTMMDYYERFDNGKVLCQKTRNADGKDILIVENEYRFHDYGDDSNVDKWYSTNMVARDELGIDPAIRYITENGNLDFQYRFKIWKYPYILSWIELSKTTSTEKCSDGSTVITKKNYSYNKINRQVSQIDENTSLSGQTRRTKTTYSADGKDDISKKMKNAHRLNDVVETKTLLVVNGKEKCISTQHTTFAVNGAYFLPASFSKSIGSAALEIRSRYSYDAKRNIRSIAVDSLETVYIWSYNGLYPIAKIEGLTYAKVLEAIGETKINNLLGKAVPSATEINSIRDIVNKKGGYITTYTYKPLIGIASETLPNGNTVYYDYDTFGRLKNVRDHKKKILKSYDYNYKK